LFLACGLAVALSLTLSLKGEGTGSARTVTAVLSGNFSVAGENHYFPLARTAPSPFRERAGERERS